MCTFSPCRSSYLTRLLFIPVSLTKTVKKTRETKVLLMSKIKDLCKSHTHIYIISIDNERNQILKDLRKARKDDVFVFGSNKVIAKALGTDEKTECRSGINILSKVSNYCIYIH